MPLRRPFAWFLLIGIGCSLAGLYRIVDDAPSARAVAPASRASATSTASSGPTNVAPTSVTEAPPAASATVTSASPEATPVASASVAPANPEVAPANAEPAAVLPLTTNGISASAVPSTQKAGALLDLMNDARLKQGLPVLDRDSALDVVAMARAQNLVQNGYFDHYAPDGESAFSELAARGIRYRLAGENLARNNFVDNRTVDAAFEALMASAGHRANILEPRFSSVGVAAVLSGKMWVYVTVFTN